MISGSSSEGMQKKLYKPHYHEVTSSCEIRKVHLKRFGFKKISKSFKVFLRFLQTFQDTVYFDSHNKGRFHSRFEEK